MPTVPLIRWPRRTVPRRGDETRSRRHGPAAGALLVAASLATVLLGGCRIVPGPFVPEVAGIVTAVETADNGLPRYVLEGGRTFTLEKPGRFLYEGGQVVGELLLAGHDSGGPWLALIMPAARYSGDLPPGCYALDGRGTDRGDSIQTDVGLLLRKAPGFDPGLYPVVPGDYTPTAYPGMRYEGVRMVFCLDEEGLVTAAR